MTQKQLDISRLYINCNSLVMYFCDVGWYEREGERKNDIIKYVVSTLTIIQGLIFTDLQFKVSFPFYHSHENNWFGENNILQVSMKRKEQNWTPYWSRY